MKRVMVMLMAVFLCSLSAWCQISAVTIGKAVTQCNDFAFAKKMLANDGLVYNQKSSTASCAVYEYPATYADEALIVKVYKLPKKNKVEKCVILIGQKHLSRYSSDLREYGYNYTDPNGLSIEPFQELYECDELAVGNRINSRGWFEATFFRWGQGAKFD